MELSILNVRRPSRLFYLPLPNFRIFRFVGDFVLIGGADDDGRQASAGSPPIQFVVLTRSQIGKSGDQLERS